MPTRWGGASHLDAQTQDVKVSTPGATLAAGPDQSERELHARPGRQVVLAYDIVPQQTEWFRHPQEHTAIINDGYVLFNSQNALVYPELTRADIVSATFDSRALPKGMPFLSSFGVGRRLLHVRAHWYEVLGALFAGGNFRIHSKQREWNIVGFGSSRDVEIHRRRSVCANSQSNRYREPILAHATDAILSGHACAVRRPIRQLGRQRLHECVHALSLARGHA